MSRFGYFHFELNFSVKDSLSKVVDEVIQFWEKFDMPTKRKDKVLIILNKYYKQYDTLRKSSYNHKNRQSFSKLEDEFKKSLPNLFDIAPTDIFDIKAKEILKYHKENPINISKILKLTTGKNLKVYKTEDELQSGPSGLNVQNLDSSFSSTSADSTNTSINNSSDYEPPKSRNKQDGVKNDKTIVNPHVTAALDRCGISDREALLVLSATAHSLGVDLNSVKL